MLKKFLFIIMTIPFSFPSLMAIDDEHAYVGSIKSTSHTLKDESGQPPVVTREMATYLFSEEGSSSSSEEDFLEVESLLKEESQTRAKLAATRSRRIESTQGRCDDLGTLLVTTPVICCLCFIPCFIPYCLVCLTEGVETHNLMKEEKEIETKLRELDQRTQGLMGDIYLRTGRQHPKMRISSIKQPSASNWD